jgi:hypothetical protein
MRKHAALIAIIVLSVAGFAAFIVWAFVAAGRMGGGWESLRPVWPYVAGGAVAVGLLAGGLMWLAFFSSRHGYDDRVEDPFDERR